MARVVIIGAGFGGLRAAQALARAKADVLVVDRNNHHLFQPLLYQVATAGLSPAEIAMPIRSILHKNPNTQVIMADLESIQPAQKKIKVTSQGVPREIAFDYLVLATGASHSYFGHDEWAPYAPGLKSISDATLIRKNILSAFELAELETDDVKRRNLLSFAIVGGGPTGVELAGSIAELSQRALASDFRNIRPESARVILIEAGSRILASFPETLSRHAQSDLERLGVQVKSGARVTRVTDEGIWMGETFLASKTVIWAAGVVSSPVGKWLGVKTDEQGRVFVKEDLSVTEYPDIFVIGDAAHFKTNSGKALPAVAPVAMQQGRYVASVILQRLTGTRDSRAFCYQDKGNLATIGRSSAVAEVGRLHLSGFIAWATWLFVHIFYLIGYRNRLLVLIQWAWSYLTFQRGARLITGASDSVSTRPGE